MVTIHNVQTVDAIKYSGKIIVYGKEDTLNDKNIIAIADIQFPNFFDKQ